MVSGDVFRRIRLARGISQKELAAEVKCTKQMISSFENFVCVPSEELYEKLIKAIYKLPAK